MSTLVVLKENDVLILGTDSRFMKHDSSGIASDHEKKIREVAPEVFIAASGWKVALDFEQAKARVLAGELATTDIRMIGEALGRALMPYLKELVETSYTVEGLHTYGGSAVSGNADVHASVLVGRDAHGELGFFVWEYSLCEGGITGKWSEYFGDKRVIWARPGEPVVPIAQDPSTWTDKPEAVVQRILTAQKAANPQIGGPDQIIEIDSRGAHWRSQLPLSPAVDQVPGMAHATIDVGSGLSFSGAGGIIIKGGGSVNVLAGSVTGNTVGSGTGGFQVLGTPVIDGNATFVGAGVNVSGGCGANGFNPKVGGTQYYGATFSFRDLDGNTHQVKGGVIVS